MHYGAKSNMRNKLQGKENLGMGEIGKKIRDLLEKNRLKQLRNKEKS